MIKRLFPAVIALAALFGCGDSTQGSRETVRILAGSELKDLKPMLAQIEADTGITLEFEYIGTLDGADMLTREHSYDFGWFSHSKYLSLLQSENKIIRASEQIGLSPVVPAVKTRLAEKWGWTDNPDLSWQDIADKVETGEFRYALTDPTASNSGFSSVIAVQSALAGSGEALTSAQIDTSQLKSFFSGQSLTSGSSGWLSDAYVRDQHHLDGLFNYESVIMMMNASDELSEPLTPLYPVEGIVTADYPLLLLNEDKRESYTTLVEYFRRPEFQKWMMEHTYRRPITPQVALNDNFSQSYLAEIPFPAKRDTVDALLFSFLDEQKRPNTAIFVLDVSGSMNHEDRMPQLRQSLLNLSGDDNSITGQFARFRTRENVIVLPFNDAVLEPQSFQFSHDKLAIDMFRDYAHHLNADGGTAIYDAMQEAYVMAAELQTEDPERFYSIVLMTDGENRNGQNIDDFVRYYQTRSDDFSQIRTFPVLFGEANTDDMSRLANLTGGRRFDARKSGLAVIFKQIRGYQ